jgi:hypothetical protein
MTSNPVASSVIAKIALLRKGKKSSKPKVTEIDCAAGIYPTEFYYRLRVDTDSTRHHIIFLKT